MKFSILLAALPMAFAASGALEAKMAARDAAALAARENACDELNECMKLDTAGCDPCECHPDWARCHALGPFGW
ncbi:hypothetical protein HDV63DRAFT_413231 [Trichoderma sp. SZMC 28014]